MLDASAYPVRFVPRGEASSPTRVSDGVVPPSCGDLHVLGRRQTGEMSQHRYDRMAEVDGTHRRSRIGIVIGRHRVAHHDTLHGEERGWPRLHAVDEPYVLVRTSLCPEHAVRQRIRLTLKPRRHRHERAVRSVDRHHFRCSSTCGDTTNLISLGVPDR